MFVHSQIRKLRICIFQSLGLCCFFGLLSSKKCCTQNKCKCVRNDKWKTHSKITHCLLSDMIGLKTVFLLGLVDKWWYNIMIVEFDYHLNFWNYFNLTLLNKNTSHHLRTCSLDCLEWKKNSKNLLLWRKLLI